MSIITLLDMQMKMNKKLGLSIVGGAALLAVAFGLGYELGSKSQKSQIEIPGSLSSTDMEHAFGSAKSPSHEPAMSEAPAMSLGGLVAGLEKKVAANPENIDQQLLLAQTYNELDNRSKSLSLLRSLNKKSPKNAQVKITLATVLMKSENKQELQEAYQMFDEATKLKPDTGSMARMYQGEIRVKLDNMAKQ